MPYGIQIVAVFVIIRIICFYGINFCLQVLFQLGNAKSAASISAGTLI